ncbi:MAG TPA: glycosyltransferase family 4 protein [Patescibacteria group bacterium]|nr:glycosyltransferase family 4 protein [Patescibacteria group bacterium]
MRKAQKRKIAIISDAIYPYNKGGKERRIFEINSRLSTKFDVHIYTMKWWRGGNVKKDNNITLHAISKLYPLYSGKRRSVKEAVFFSLNCFKLIFEDFDYLEADHMPHLVLFPLKVVSILKRKKLLVTWSEVWGRDYWVKYMGLSGNIAYLIERLSVNLPDTIISVSSHTTKKLKKEFNVKSKIITIPNGIEFTKIRKVNESDKKSDIIFAGRLLAHKNVDVLIRAVELLAVKNPKIKCLIIGEGPEKNRLEKLTKELNLSKNIKFINFLDKHEDLYALIKASKVFAFPSDREGFGIVVLEANACGVPVVTVDSENNASKNLIQENKNGAVSELSDEAIARNIKKIISVGISKKKCIDSSKAYDWENIARNAERVYQA